MATGAATLVAAMVAVGMEEVKEVLVGAVMVRVGKGDRLVVAARVALEAMAGAVTAVVMVVVMAVVKAAAVKAAV